MHENTQFSVIFALLLYCVQVIPLTPNPFCKQSLLLPSKNLSIL